MKLFTSDQVHLGFVGVGAMGSRLVPHLCDHGYQTTVYDLDRSKAIALVDHGAWVANSPAELAEKADVILSCLTNDDAVRDVYFGRRGILSNAIAGKVVLEMSTISPATSRKLYVEGAKHGVDVMDVAISGSTPAVVFLRRRHPERERDPGWNIKTAAPFRTASRARSSGRAEMRQNASLPRAISIVNGKLNKDKDDLLLQQLSRLGGIPQRCCRVHYARGDQLSNFPVEVLHSLGCALFHELQQADSDQVGAFHAVMRPRIHLENFKRRHASAAVPPRQQPLGYDIAQCLCQPAAHGRLLVWSKRAHHLLHRLGRVHRVQAGEHQVSGFRRLHHHLRGLAIPHLPHQDDPGRLAQRRPQGQAEVRRVAVQLALVHSRVLVVVQKLDGIFDGDNVAGLLPVDPIE